jgi:hypothetical protein
MNLTTYYTNNLEIRKPIVFLSILSLYEKCGDSFWRKSNENVFPGR